MTTTTTEAKLSDVSHENSTRTYTEKQEEQVGATVGGTVGLGVGSCVRV